MMQRVALDGVPDITNLDTDLASNPDQWLEEAGNGASVRLLQAILGTGSTALQRCIRQGYQHPNGIQVVKLGEVGGKVGGKQLRLHIFGGDVANPEATRHTHAWGQRSRVLEAGGAVLDTTFRVTQEDGPNHLYEARSPVLSGSSELVRVKENIECLAVGSEEYGPYTVRYMADGVYHDARAAGTIQPITLVVNDATGANRAPLVVGTVDLGDRVVVPRIPLDPAIAAEGLNRLGLY